MKTFFPSPPARRHRGFTLVELMAAIVIMAMMTAMLFTVFNQASKAWIQGTSKVEMFQEARAALDFMARDISQIVVKSNTTPSFSAGGATFVSAVNTNGAVDLMTITYALGGSNTLTRSATVYGGSGQPASGTLADNIQSLNFRTIGGGTIPLAVEITLSVMDSRGAARYSANPGNSNQVARSFVTMVSIPYRNP